MMIPDTQRESERVQVMAKKKLEECVHHHVAQKHDITLQSKYALDSVNSPISIIHVKFKSRKKQTNKER